MSKNVLPTKTLAKSPIQRVTYNLPVAKVDATNRRNEPNPRSNPQDYLASKQKPWKMHADERLKLHKAYTEALQKQASNCFDLTSSIDPEWMGRQGGIKGGKVGRAMGDRWRRPVADGRMGHSSEAGFEENRREEGDKGRRLRDRMSMEARRKRETWERKSTVAREGKKLAEQISVPWTENDHAHQARSLLTQTLKDREKLYSQNDRLIGMAREVEVLSEKLRIAEGLVAKHQTKLRNQDMFIRNLELSLESRAPIEKMEEIAAENERLKKTCSFQKNMLEKSTLRADHLQKQLEEITQMQLMADMEDGGTVVPRSPTKGEVKKPDESRPREQNEEETPKIETVPTVSVTIEVPKEARKPDKAPRKSPLPQPLASTKPMHFSKPLIGNSKSTKQYASSKVLDSSILNKPSNGADNDTTSNAVALLQQYIRNLIAENQKLKGDLDSIVKPDPKRDLFPEFVKLRRENVKMKKVLAKMGVDESAYKKKSKPAPKVITRDRAD